MIPPKVTQLRIQISDPDSGAMLQDVVVNKAVLAFDLSTSDPQNVEDYLGSQVQLVTIGLPVFQTTILNTVIQQFSRVYPLMSYIAGHNQVPFFRIVPLNNDVVGTK